MNKSKGFTLIELMVTVAIIAVIAAISIPIIAGLINKSKETSDNKTAAQMTTAIEQWTSEYVLFAEDVRSGTNINTVTHERVKTAINSLGYIANINANGLSGFEKDAINKNTKYPKGDNDAVIAVRVINLLKTYMKNIDDGDFQPRQANHSYWYLVNSSTVVCAPSNSTEQQLFDLLSSEIPASSTYWINLSKYKDNADKVSVTITQVGTGGNISGNGNNYQIGDTVHLQADDGTQGFKGWYDQNGNLISTDKNYSFTITGSQNITAKYGDTVDVTIGTKGLGGGYVEGGGSYKIGATVTLTAHPNVYDVFVGWYINNTKVSEETSYTFVANTDTKVVAEFKVATCNISVEGGNGKVSGSGIYPKDADVTVSFMPDEGYEFVNWIDKTTNTVLSSSASYTFKTTKGMSLYAVSKRKEFRITGAIQNLMNNEVVSSSNGTISGVGTYYYNDEVILRATPTSQDWAFAYWKDASNDKIISNNSTFSFQVTKDARYIACFRYVKGEIPAGCEYIAINKTYENTSDEYTYENSVTYSEGETMPPTPKPGDIYTTPQYTYVYQAYYYDNANTYDTYDGQWCSYLYEDGWLVSTFNTRELSVFTEDILSKINGKNVISMDYCYANTKVREINSKIPSTIKTHEYACANATNLTKTFAIPSNWKTLSYTFQNCANLQYVNIPSGVEELIGTFENAGLTSLPHIPSSVTSIESAFKGTKITQLKTGAIPSSVVNMDAAFSGCKNLRIIQDNAIQASEIESATGAFFQCTSLATVGELPKKILNCNSIFLKCSSLQTVTNMPYSNNYTNALASCPALKGIIRFDSVPSSATTTGLLSSSCQSRQVILYSHSTAVTSVLKDTLKLQVKFSNCIVADFVATERNYNRLLEYGYEQINKGYIYTLIIPQTSGTYQMYGESPVTVPSPSNINYYRTDSCAVLYDVNVSTRFNLTDGLNAPSSSVSFMQYNNNGSSTGNYQKDLQFKITTTLEAGKPYLLKTYNVYHNKYNNGQSGAALGVPYDELKAFYRIVIR